MFTLKNIKAILEHFQRKRLEHNPIRMLESAITYTGINSYQPVELKSDLKPLTAIIKIILANRIPKSSKTYLSVYIQPSPYC